MDRYQHTSTVKDNTDSEIEEEDPEVAEFVKPAASKNKVIKD